MLYASLKALHLLGIVAWVGGMFFMLVCLRPALATVEPPLRVRLMHAVAYRFLWVVAVTIGTVLATGIALIAIASSSSVRAGIGFNMPVDWYVMAVLGVTMMLVFGHIRFALFPRLTRAVATEDWPAGGAALLAVRRSLIVNLVLAVVIIVVTRLGTAASAVM